MKKCLSLLVCAVLLLTLTACNFAELLDMKSEPKVEEMLAALSEGNAEAALSLLHPDAADAENVQQLIEFMDGRQVAKLTRRSIQKNANVGTGGSSKTEAAEFGVELEDGTEITLSVVYLTNGKGEGFSTFSIQLG